MADIRIKDLTTLASASLTGDVFVIDGTTGTRKLSAFSPTFGGNATVTGTLSSGGNLSVTGTSAQVILGQASSSQLTYLIRGAQAGGAIQIVQDALTVNRWLSLGISDNLGVYSELMRVAGATGNILIPGTVASTTTSSGALVVGNGTSGGLGVGGSVNINNNLTLGYASAGDSVLKIIRSSGGNEWLQIAGWNGGSLGNNAYSIDAVNGASARPVYFRRSTDAGSTYTNFLTWDTSNNATFAGTLTANTSVSSPQLVISSDSLGLSGGAGFYKKEADTVALGVMTSNTLRAWIRTTDARWFYQSGTPVTIQDTTASTATNIGALVVSGGVGVGNEVSVYGRVRAQLGLHADGNVPAGLASAYQVDLQAGTSRDILSFGDSSRAGLIRGEQDGSGRATLKFGRYTPSTFAEYLRITGVAATDAVLSVYGTTSSTSTSSGALVVSGGVGVAGAIYAGGLLSIGRSAADTQAIFGDGSRDTNIQMKSTGNVTSNVLAFDSGVRLTIGATTPMGAYVTVYNGVGINKTAPTEALDVVGNGLFSGTVKTGAPSGGTAAAWKLGTVATVSPTSPNRTIEVDIGGTIYYIHAKTTNN